MLQKALTDMRAVRGQGDIDSINVLSSLALAKMAAGHLEQAEVDMRHASELSDRRAPHAIEAISPQLGLVTCLLLQQRLPEAERVQQRLEVDCLQLQGSEGLYYSYALLLRADIDFVHGNYAKVIEDVRHLSK